MHNQSHPVHHAIYVNSPEADDDSQTSLRYDELLDEASDDAKTRTYLGYGKSGTYHQNYALALTMVELDDYDLFLKIDDDDIYLSGYVEGVVRDFLAKGWDYSGTHSHGIINGSGWYPRAVVDQLGRGHVDHTLGIPAIMPATAAFSRRAMDVVIGTVDTGAFEDDQWSMAIATAGLRMMQRHDENYIHHVHGGNISSGSLPVARLLQAVPKLTR